MFPNTFSYVELVELDMLDFDIILGMEWLHAYFSSIDCRTRVVKFNFPNEPILEWKRKNPLPRVLIIACFKACNMISKGCIYHIVRFKDLESDIPPIGSIPIVKDIPEVFPN